jgi:prefoldin beta subunit
MDLDNETKEKIQELQLYEQSFQNLIMQKQAFQIELNETENAITEVSQSTDDVFKLVGNIMVKADKEKLKKELAKKKDLLSLRLNSIEKQESELTQEIESLRDEIIKKVNAKEK